MAKFNSTMNTCKNGVIVTLRSAIEADASKMNNLATDVFSTSDYLKTTAEEFSVFSDELQIERLRKFENEKSDLLLVVEHNDELDGMLDFQSGKKKRTSHRGVFALAVKSSWRGKGIGKILLTGLRDWVKNHSTIELITLVVMEENKPALSLYSKMGFVMTGKEPYGTKLGDDKYLTDLSMSLLVKK